MAAAKYIKPLHWFLAVQNKICLSAKPPISNTTPFISKRYKYYPQMFKTTDLTR